MNHKFSFLPIAIKVFLVLAIGCCFCLGQKLNGAPYLGLNHQEDAKQDDKKKPIEFSLADGKIAMSATGKWEKVKPRSNMIDVEFSVRSAKDDEKPGRITMMGAGGSIDANIDRWASQFKQTDGEDTRQKATKVTEETIAEQDVTIVSITGTYLDRPIPIRPQQMTQREGYRMLSAIIETENLGNYFIKFYGPKKTVDSNEKAFMEMVKSMKLK